MNTLNYWLGKLQRLQLIGHGTKRIIVMKSFDEEELEVTQVYEKDGVVYIEVS